MTTKNPRTKPSARKDDAAAELNIATPAWRVGVLLIRDEHATVRVTLPDCPCPDMFYRHPAPLVDADDPFAGPEDEPFCKHIKLFYERLADKIAPGQDTFVMGSLTGRTRSDGTPVSYELTLMKCSVHGVISDPSKCGHAVTAYRIATGWHALPEIKIEDKSAA
jgi:hypothetical protein